MDDDQQYDLFGWRPEKDASSLTFDWALAKNAARELDQQSGGDREGRADRGDRRRSPPAEIVLFPRGHSGAKRPALLAEGAGPLFASATAEDQPQQQDATIAPSAEPVAFPLARRRPLVARLLKLMKEASSTGDAERILQGRLARVRRTLRRKHVPEPVIARDLERLASAVYALLPAAHSEGRANG